MNRNAREGTGRHAIQGSAPGLGGLGVWRRDIVRHGDCCCVCRVSSCGGCGRHDIAAGLRESRAAGAKQRRVSNPRKGFVNNSQQNMVTGSHTMSTSLTETDIRRRLPFRLFALPAAARFGDCDNSIRVTLTIHYINDVRWGVQTLRALPRSTSTSSSAMSAETATVKSHPLYERSFTC